MLGDSSTLHRSHPLDWIDEYVVRSYESDAEGKASLPTLCRFFQESAWHHAESMRLGYAHLAERGVFWVLSRLSVRMTRYPLWGERVRVRTWASGLDRLFALRDFTVANEQGEIICAAVSGWLVLGEATRKPQRPEKLFEGAAVLTRIRAFEGGPEKIPALDRPEKGPAVTARYGDIDMQGHVNNARLAEWILNGFPAETHRKHRVSRFSINFLAECSCGDCVSVQTERAAGGGESSPIVGAADGGAYLVNILRESDGREICRAMVTWG
jgi:medium-chain acyl-[acyl-carrier-protein] hydrolase